MPASGFQSPPTTLPASPYLPLACPLPASCLPLACPLPAPLPACRVSEGVLEKYEHLDKLKHGSGTSTGSDAAGATSASAPTGGYPGGAPPEGGGGGEGDTLKTDAPGAGETQHPGETTGTSLYQEKVGGQGPGGLGWRLGLVGGWSKAGSWRCAGQACQEMPGPSRKAAVLEFPACLTCR